MICDPRPLNENLRRDEAAARALVVTTHDYRLHLDFSNAQDQDAPSFVVRTEVDFDATEGADTFLDYLGHEVNAVSLNGRALAPEDVVDGARIHLPGLAAHNTAIVESRSYYSRSGEGVHRFVDPADGATYLYSQNEPADCRRIYPCFEQPDLKARFSTRITAPNQWHVASNGRLENVEDAAGPNSTREFARTEPMSTYITTFLAGPYATWSDHYSGNTASGEHVEIPLGVLTRASIAEHADTEEIFEVTKRGLDWFHQNFDVAYPWGKYDQAFVPEYNLGAMENPGLVTFTESYIFTSAATEAQHEQRANTILHEMCHMWFGDLVTMKWWDDLWLKESFADYVGALAVDEATDFTTSWTTFASRRKAWAYRQDQYPTTHPIVADIVDLEAADQNFDGITYAKGASVLKQLSAYVGRDTFLAAARDYFRANAWGNTTLADFLKALGSASGRDMSGWATAWLETVDVSTLTLNTETAADGSIARATLRQECMDPDSGDQVLRPHVVHVGAYKPMPDGPARLIASPEVRFEDASGVLAQVAVPELVGLPGDTILLPNDLDLTYALVVPEAASLDRMLDDGLDSELARATAFAAAWNLVRAGELAPERFVDGVVATSDLLEDTGVLSQVFGQATSGLVNYTGAEERQELLARWSTWLLEAVVGDPEPSDVRTVRLRALLSALEHVQAPAEETLDVIATWLDPSQGFELGEELTWAALTVFAAHGRVDAASLTTRQAAAPTAVSSTGLTKALAAIPNADVKAAARRAAYSGRDASGAQLSNDQLQAVIDGLGVDPSHADAADPAEYFERLAAVWREQTQGQSTRVIKGLYPADAEIADGDARSHPTVQATVAWLDGMANEPVALRRLVIEALDDVRRRLRAQAA
ncbi:MAG: aminopeptidase N [Galactobacter sp.]